MNPAVGILHEVTSPASVVVGREVAVNQALLAMGRLSRGHDLLLFCDPRAREKLARSLAPEPGIRIVDRGRLLREPGAFHIAAWFEPQLDLHRPFAIREKLGGAWPVTVLHHTLSYPRLLHDAFLRLLLADTRPYDAFFCASTAARDALREIVHHVGERFARRHGVELRFPGRYELVPIGVDTERFRPLDRLTSRERFGLDPGAFVMLWVGRMSLIDKADLLPLVRVLADLRTKHPGRPLILVCAGVQRPGEQFGDVLGDYARACGVGDAVRVITDREEFMPWMPHLYSAADVFVSPVDNIQETFGITPVEAMACGVPQVVSDWDGYRDTVVDGETGFLIPTRWAACAADLDAGALLEDPAYDHLAMASSVAVDMEALSRAVETLMDDPALQARMSAASRRRAEAVFAWSLVVSRYEDLWGELRREAESTAPSPPRGPAYDEPDYDRFFASYPSHRVEEDATLVLTPAGRGLFAGGDLPTHYNRSWQYLDLNLLQRVLAGFQRFDAQGKGLSLGRAAAVLAGDDPLRRAVVVRHVLWLLKYGYLTLEDPLASIHNQ